LNSVRQMSIFISTSPSNTVLGRPRTFVSKQPSYVLLPYGLCVMCTCTTENSYKRSHHLSLQLTVEKSLISSTVASSQKTDPFKYGAKIYIGAMDTAIRPVEVVPSYTGKTSTIQTCIQMFFHWLSNSFQCYLRHPQAVHILQGKN